MLKKLFLTLALLLLPLFRPTISLAAPDNFADAACGDLSLEKYINGCTKDNTRGMLGVMSESLTCQIIGCYTSTNQPASSGLVPAFGKTIASLYTPSVSAHFYFANLLRNMGLPSTTVYAANNHGSGYNYLSTYLGIWKVFRNLAYSVYIIIFVVIGFMIMFRTKVNAQTVVTIQNALPNLVFTLILITFSYAIAGFLVDLMYFAIYFSVYLFSPIFKDPGSIVNRMLSKSFYGLLVTNWSALTSHIAKTFQGLVEGVFDDNIFIHIAELFAPDVSFYKLIVASAFFIQSFKLLIQLFKAYVMFIVQVVTAPIQLLFNALPGSKSLSNWLKRTVANLAPFPIVALMFIFAAYLIGPNCSTAGENTNPRCWFTTDNYNNPFGLKDSATISGESIWLPPFMVPSASIPANSLTPFIGFFVIMLAPSAVKMAQDFFQVKESPYASEAMAGLQSGFTPIRMVSAWKRSREEKQRWQKLANQQGGQ